MADKYDSYLEILRPALQSDGGDVEVVAFDQPSGTLKLRFLGACSHCAILDTTLTRFIQERLLEHFPELKKIEAVA